MQPEVACIKERDWVLSHAYPSLPPSTDTSPTEIENCTFPITPKLLLISKSLPASLEFPKASIT